ncbi:hypothetical protein ACFO4O_09585 [Glaciecola siphonariae]|uniref:Solute-binding protein family 3/N-terminal domain-containing protein n=1 Tax=Glaciecola siphonariae TaxID=521012 RepID=A0ABV9LWQ0_9ALTE
MKHLFLFVAFLCSFSSCSSAQATDFVFDEVSDMPFHSDVRDTLEQAYSLLEHKISYRSVPLKRSYREAESGRLSGLMGRVFYAQDNYKNLVRVPVPIASFDIVLVVNTHSCSQCDVTNIKQVTAVSGFEALLYYRKNNKVNFMLSEVSDRATLLNMMDKERIEAMIISRVLLPDELLSANPHWKVTTLATEYLFHYLTQENAYLIPELSGAIQTVLEHKLLLKNTTLPH